MIPNKKITTLLVLLIVINGTLPFSFIACNEVSIIGNANPKKLEITGQTATVLKEGRYYEVIIQVNYSCDLVFNSEFIKAFFPNAVFATSPAPPTYKNKISRVEISITDQFDNSHLAEDDLQELFSITNYYVLTPTTNVFPITPDDSRNIYLLLKALPSANLQTKISITSYLDDGRILISKGIALVINRS